MERLDREPGGRQDVPEDAIADQPVIGRRDPRLDHVALSEQLCARVSHEHDIAGEEAVEQEKAQPAGGVVRHLPSAGLDRLHASHELCARGFDLVGGDSEPQLRVGFQDLDRALDGQPPFLETSLITG